MESFLILFQTHSFDKWIYWISFSIIITSVTEKEAVTKFQSFTRSWFESLWSKKIAIYPIRINCDNLLSKITNHRRKVFFSIWMLIGIKNNDIPKITFVLERLDFLLKWGNIAFNIFLISSVNKSHKIIYFIYEIALTSWHQARYTITTRSCYKSTFSSLFWMRYYTILNKFLFCITTIFLPTIILYDGHKIDIWQIFRNLFIGHVLQ